MTSSSTGLTDPAHTEYGNAFNWREGTSPALSVGQPAADTGEILVGQADTWVDAVQQCGRGMVGRRPCLVGGADLVVEPDKPTAAAHPTRSSVFQCSPTGGSSAASDHVTSGSTGSPSLGAISSLACAIHVVAHTSSHLNANNLGPSAGSSRSSNGLPAYRATGTGIPR